MAWLGNLEKALNQLRNDGTDFRSFENFGSRLASRRGREIEMRTTRSMSV